MDIREQRRERFEEKAFAKRFINSVKRVNGSQFGLQSVDCPTKAEFVAKDAEGNYLDNGLNFAWWGFNAALDGVEIEPVEQFGEPNPDSYDHRGSDPKYIEDKAEFEANQARDALWIAAIEAAGLQVKQ